MLDSAGSTLVERGRQQQHGDSDAGDVTMLAMVMMLLVMVKLMVMVMQVLQ